MLCPFKKVVSQMQKMPSAITPDSAPSVEIDEEFKDCSSDDCMAYDAENGICKLVEKNQ